MEILAVIFDFGRVISDFDIGRFVERAARSSGLSREAVNASVARSMDAATRYETGLMTSHEFFEEVSRISSLAMPEDEFVRAYTDIFTPKPATLALIRELSSRYRLGLLSNTNAWHFEFGIQPVPVFPLFEAVTLSFEVRAMKPDPRIYADMLGKLALPAEACAYIDDIPEFVEAGRALGLRAIRYTTQEHLLADLRAIGIDVPQR